jgi:hypothetical protein
MDADERTWPVPGQDAPGATPADRWVDWKRHLIGCVDCTAGEVCAEGRAILGGARPTDAPWLAPAAPQAGWGALLETAADGIANGFRVRDWSMSDLEALAAALRALATALELVTPEVDEFTSGALGRLRKITQGAKGDRPDYGAMISCQDALLIVTHIASLELRAKAAALPSLEVRDAR